MKARSMSATSGPKPPPRGEDLLYDDGEPMESERHREQMFVLIDTLQEAWRDRRDFYVGGNMAVYYSETQARRNDFRAPDFFVVLDTDRHERKGWVVWEEDGRTPDVVVEITSESTEHVDRGEKMRIYARLLRVATYAIYDPATAKLDVFALDAKNRRYERVLPDERGLHRCDPLGLWLGVAQTPWKHLAPPWLRFFDAEGKELPSARERAEREAERAEREAERAEREAERAEREAARVAELEAELAALRRSKS